MIDRHRCGACMDDSCAIILAVTWRPALLVDARDRPALQGASLTVEFHCMLVCDLTA